MKSITTQGRTSKGITRMLFEDVISMTRKRIVAVVVALVVLGCGLTVNLQAQASSCSQFFDLQKSHPSCLDVWPPLDFAHVAPTAVCCNQGGIPFGETCIALSSSCAAPPNAARETCVACNRKNSPSASAPIDLATGNTYIEQTDLSVPGLG